MKVIDDFIQKNQDLTISNIFSFFFLSFFPPTPKTVCSSKIRNLSLRKIFVNTQPKTLNTFYRTRTPRQRSRLKSILGLSLLQWWTVKDNSQIPILELLPYNSSLLPRFTLKAKNRSIFKNPPIHFPLQVVLVFDCYFNFTVFRFKE